MKYTPYDFRIINAHTHIFPHKIAEKASLAIGDFYDVKMKFPGEAEVLLADGAPFNVEKYLVCSTATIPNQVQRINDFIHENCKIHDKFLGFGSLHPQMEGIEEEAERIVSLGLRGIKLHSDFQKFDIDDPAAFPIYESAARLGLPILFHMGDDRYDYSRPYKLLNIAEKFPKLICIGAHFGGYKCWDESFRLLRRENIFFDTSSSLEFMPAGRAIEFIENFGAERFFWGTDFPMWRHDKELENFLGLGLTKRQYEQIFFENFANLMGL